MRKYARDAVNARPACPIKKKSERVQYGLGQRSAIYVPFPQAVPNKPVIDRLRCSYLRQENVNSA